MLRTVDSERIEARMIEVRDEAVERLTVEAAGILDAVITKLLHGKIKLVGHSASSSIIPTEQQTAAAAGLVDCMLQSLLDDPPLAVKPLVAELDPFDEILDIDPVLDAARREYSEAIKGALQ